MSPAQRLKLGILAALMALAIGWVLTLQPLPQDLAYHQFGDQRRLAGVPNALNVLSNLAFLIVGATGLAWQRRGALAVARRQQPILTVLWLGVIGTGLGSAWYHLAPDNSSLMWDRLAMAVAFMALTALVVADLIDLRLGSRLLWPLVLAGTGSVLWWYLTEQDGAGDLRAYALVQFLPVALLPLILLWFRSSWSCARHYWGLLACYGLAKLCEVLDRELLALTGVVSGHTLKHLAAAAGIAWLLWMLARRRRLPAESAV